MNFTNRSGLPDALLRAVKNDPYNKGDAEFSITELIGPARIAALREQHKHEIEEDVEEVLYRLYGQIVSVILERANKKDLAEERLYGVTGGVRWSGQLDSLDLDESILSDWKLTSLYGFKPGVPPKPEWVYQLNGLLELLRQNGKDAKKLQIVGLLRDWSKMKAAREGSDYPQAPSVILPIPMWERPKTEAYIWGRIVAHRQARKVLPECTPEERWAKDDVHAVMKKGRKSAIKLHTEVDTALKQARELGAGHSVEFRPGESTRCLHYCPVSKFCSQFQAMTAAAVTPLASVTDLNDAKQRNESA